VAGGVAHRAEQHGYRSFWVNGSPPAKALESLEAAADSSGLDLGVGVLPLTAITAEEVVAEVRRLDLPQERLWLGVGSSRSPGALAEVRRATGIIRAELEVRVVAAAVGPRMTELAGEVADAVIFTWWPAAEVVNSRRLLEAAAERAGRTSPLVASYIRCALLPEAQAALQAKADAYAAIPRYAEVFARNQVRAEETVVTGADADELASGIEKEEQVLDTPIIRAITAEDTTGSISALLEACAPRDS